MVKNEQKIAKNASFLMIFALMGNLIDNLKSLHRLKNVDKR